MLISHLYDICIELNQLVNFIALLETANYQDRLLLFSKLLTKIFITI